MPKEKVYKVLSTKHGLSGSRKTEYEGTIAELIHTFSYTLRVGYSWNKKITTVPKTIKALVKNVNLSYEEIERGYSFTSIEEIK